MPRRPCLDCGALTATGSRCEPCRKRRQAAASRGRGPRPQYGSQWRTLSKRIRAEYVARFGWVCPGWEREPHVSTDLVVDHTALAVLCRRCNSSKAGRWDKREKARREGGHPPDGL